MTTSAPFVNALAKVALACLLATTSLSVVACKGTKGDSAASAATSSSAVLAALEPCTEYAEKVCAKAGDQSPTCASFKEATSLMTPATCSAGIKDIEVSLKKLGDARGDCDKLIKALCDAIGPETKTCGMVTTQTAQFPPARCKSMLEQIPEVTADLKKMEAANQPLSAEVQAEIAANTAPAFGPADAKVTIVEFSDFECPYCSRAASVVHQVREKYGSQVRFVFRQFPLPGHSHAKGAAKASLAAFAQGKFWEFHDLLFENQQSLDEPALEQHAKKTGLDLAKFKKAFSDDKVAAQVEADVKLGEKAQVSGTPTMFINGSRVENPTDFGVIAKLIDAALTGTPPG